VEFEVALKDHARKLLEGEVPLPENAEKWKLLPDGIRSDLQDAFLHSLFGDLQTSKRDGLTNWIQLYGNRLLAWSELPKRQDEVVRVLYSPIVDRANLQEVAWLQESMERFPEMLANCNKSIRIEFEERLKSAMRRQDLSEDQEQRLRAIAGAAGVKVPEPAPEEEEQGPAEDEVEEEDETQ